MKGLKVIPMFLILIVLSYFGIWFVEANRTEIVIHLGQREVPPTAVGFVVLTSILIGMVIAGFLCSIELLALYVQNRKLKRRVLAQTAQRPEPAMDREISPKPQGRFT